LAVDRVNQFLQQRAAPTWRSLAPRLAAPGDNRQLALGQRPFAAQSNFEHARVTKSDERLATAIQAVLLAHDAASNGSVDNTIARQHPQTRILGAVYESLLGRRVDWRNEQVELVTDNSRRRRSGSYYTPRTLIEALVTETLSPLFRDQPKARTPADRAVKVIDPAMGSGHILLAAFDQLVAHVSELDKRHKLSGTALVALKCNVLSRAIHGVDVDPDTVELARLSLWLHSGLSIDHAQCLTQNLRCGDSLIAETLPAENSDRFDAVIGNPPYGVASEPYRSELRRVLPQTRHNADLAVAFIERSLQMVAPGGRVGLVLPKPLTYSYAWRHVRRLLVPRTTWICDVGRGWDDVLLEQTLVVLAAEPDPEAELRVGSRASSDLPDLPIVPRSWPKRFDVLLSALTFDDVARLQSLRFSDATLGDLCRTFRGLPWQRLLQSTGETPIYSGRDLERWGVRSTSGFVTASQQHARLSDFAQPKLLFQNIVAHVARPEPHLRLIGAWDTQGRVTLDTVNNLVARATGVDLRSVLALLHSETVNWLVYSVVYNRAIRTMHFDQYFIDKIPLPEAWDNISAELAALAEECLMAQAEIGHGYLHSDDAGPLAAATQSLERSERKIDRLVAEAYGDRSPVAHERDKQCCHTIARAPIEIPAPRRRVKATAGTRSSRAARRR
jgi:hypothetical protein